jgi:DNA repair photolyase
MKPSWNGKPLSISGNTDCYQPVERKYRLTRALLLICLQMGQPVGLITKNTAILQDLDVLEALAKEGLVHVFFSISTLDEDLRRVLEPRTATAQGKLKALAKLTSVGVPCGVMNAPIIPGLNDHEVPAIVEAAADAGALAVGYNFVRLNGAIGQIFTNWITQALPDRAPKVLRQISSGHAGKLNDSQFGRRMRGEGLFADTVAQLHAKAKQAYLSNAVMPGYNYEAFRRGGQLGLF